MERDIKGHSFLKSKKNFLLEKTDSCKDENLYFLILVHSKPEHFLKRRIIRDTWGSVKKYKNLNMNVLFLMGKPGGGKKEDVIRGTDKEVGMNSVLKSRSLHHHDTFFKSRRKNNPFNKVDSILKLLELESDLHRDILLGNFNDTPGNESQKHLLGFKWVLDKCGMNPPTFVLKMEDNVFLEIFHLFNFVSAVYGTNPDPSLICDVVPSGTFGHKHDYKRNYRHRDLTSTLFPKSCSGAAYLITPGLLRHFVEARKELPSSFQEVPEDVIMTGLVREHLEVSPIYLNLRYTYERSQAERWLNNGQPYTPLPFLFVVQSNNIEERIWSNLVKSLWSKSVKIQEDFDKMLTII